MRQQICGALYRQTREVPITLILGRNRGGLLLVFSGVPKYMRAFAQAWPDPAFVQEVLAQLP